MGAEDSKGAGEGTRVGVGDSEVEEGFIDLPRGTCEYW